MDLVLFKELWGMLGPVIVGAISWWATRTWEAKQEERRRLREKENLSAQRAWDEHLRDLEAYERRREEWKRRAEARQQVLKRALEQLALAVDAFAAGAQIDRTALTTLVEGVAF